MKTKLVILFTLLLILISKVCYAQDLMAVDIVCDGRNVSVSGNLPNISQSEIVTIMVGDLDNIIYINQEYTTESGAFTFTFTVSENLRPGVYNIAIGTNADIPTYYGKVYYRVTQNEFLSADLDVTLSAYVPTLSGTVSCTEGKIASFTVLNLSDNNVICSEEITSDTGIFDLSYTLPSLISGKEYRVVISCKENDITIAEISANIDTSIFAVHMDAAVVVEDNIEIDTHIRTINSNLLNTNNTIKENKTFSANFPNLLPNTAFKIIANGRELVPIQENISDSDNYLYKAIKAVDISENDDVPYFIQVRSVGDLENKIIVVEYPQDKLSLADACVFTSKKETNATNIEYLGINIKSVTDGKVEFAISDNFINNHTNRIVISGLLFEAISDGAADISCKIVEGSI